MPITLDLSDLKRSTREAKRLFKLLEREPARFVKEASDWEKATHAYQNRTGRLEASTQGFSMAGAADGDFDVLLRAGMDYASYVNARGFMTIDASARYVDRRITALIGQIAYLLAH